jgi:cytokinesis protein
MKIDRYKERIDNMLFRISFNEKYQQLAKVRGHSLLKDGRKAHLDTF